MDIDRGEFLRYLGWKGEADEEFSARLDDAAKRCLALCTPRSAVRRFALDGMTLVGAGFTLEGEDIRRHLQGCKEVYLFAATVGGEVEREAARLMRKSAHAALLFDTAASCAVESYCDDICASLAADCGKALTDRFSCGYGDFPLQAQREICRILRTDTRIGLCCDESFLLTPRKSVTAVVGITDAPAAAPRGCSHRCGSCNKRDCAFRR